MKPGNFVSVLCLAALVGGCAVADTGSFVRLQEEMEGLKKEVAAVKAGAASAPSPGGTGGGGLGEVSSMQKSVADLTASYDQLKSDQVASTTRADEMKVQLQRDISRLNEKTAAHDQALQEIRTRVSTMDDLSRRVAALEERTGGSPAPPAAPAPPPQSWKSPEEMYDYALGLIKSGDARKGRQILQDFPAKYPGHRLLPNVLYWKGETYYAEKDYENAILSFQDVIDKYPGGDKAPDAMYKQGLSFLALKDRKNARILFELVQSKYPKSAAASQARQKLAELK